MHRVSQSQSIEVIKSKFNILETTIALIQKVSSWISSSIQNYIVKMIIDNDNNFKKQIILLNCFTECHVYYLLCLQ